jgi:Leucine-rich repeat (LRR) protein
MRAHRNKGIDAVNHNWHSSSDAKDPNTSRSPGVSDDNSECSLFRHYGFQVQLTPPPSTTNVTRSKIILDRNDSDEFCQDKYEDEYNYKNHRNYKSDDNNTECSDNQQNTKLPPKHINDTGRQRERVDGRSFSQRMLSSFLNSHRNNLRQPDQDDVDVMKDDSRTECSNDSIFQKVLQRGRNYTSTRGQWNDELYPHALEIDTHKSHSAHDLTGLRQDSRLSIIRASLVSKETTGTIASKVTFENTSSGETPSSRQIRPKVETDSTDTTYLSHDQQIQAKMRSMGYNAPPSITPPPTGTQRLGMLNDGRSNITRASMPSVPRRDDGQSSTIENESLPSVKAYNSRSVSIISGGSNSQENGGADVMAQNPHMSTEHQRQRERAGLQVAMQPAAPSHAALLNLPGRTRYARSDGPGAVPMHGRPYCAPALRTMDATSLNRAMNLAALQQVNNFPDVVTVCSGTIPQARSFSDHVVSPKKLSSQKWQERPKRTLACLGIPICIGLIIVLAGVAVVVRTWKAPSTSHSQQDYPPPTSMPSLVWDYLLDDLQSISDRQALINPVSPQHKAAYWLSQMDGLPQDFVLSNVLQRYSLVVIYHALTKGGASASMNGWLDTGRHECEWGTSIVCGASGLSDKKIVSLDLRQLNLEGSIPDEIRFLDRLESLQMNNNTISGSIPFAIGLLTNLQVMELERNAITGGIPPTIGDMTSLTSLDLSHNFLNNSLPDNLFHLSGLRRIDLSFNQFIGPLSDRFIALSLLSTIDVRMNKFTGTIPTILTELSDLDVLNIDYNEISGELPQDFLFIAKRGEWTASNNAITGTVPGEAPPEMKEKITQEFLGGKLILRKVDISHNLLSGTIPTLFGTLPEMKHIDFKDNLFTGLIPSFADTIAEYICVANNCLTGSVPTQFSKILRYMDYSGNRLSGSIPTEVGTINRLEYLDLSGNKALNGTLPSELGSLQRVQHLAIGNCSLTGALPPTLNAISNIVFMALDGNHLNGSIPSAYESLVLLQELYLNKNALSGTIPTTLGQLAALEKLNLSGNKLTGHVPDELSSLGNLIELFLSDNTLTGSVPVGLCNMLGNDFSNFENMGIDCRVACECCEIKNYGGQKCNTVSL